MLSSNESIVAEYLAKVLGLHIQNLCRKDLLFMMMCYMADMKNGLPESLEPAPECPIDKNDMESVRKAPFSPRNVGDYLLRRSEDCTESVDNHSSHVVCYRCKHTGHIAKGCKEYKCFKCNEIGHVVAGCRKKSRGNCKTHCITQSVTTSMDQGSKTDSAAESLILSDKVPSSSSPLTDDVADCISKSSFPSGTVDDEAAAQPAESALNSIFP